MSDSKEIPGILDNASEKAMEYRDREEQGNQLISRFNKNTIRKFSKDIRFIKRNSYGRSNVTTE